MSHGMSHGLSHGLSRGLSRGLSFLYSTMASFRMVAAFANFCFQTLRTWSDSREP